MSELNNASLADRLESFIPNGDGYNSDYANTLTEAVDALRTKPDAELVELLRECRAEFDTSEASAFEVAMRARIDAKLASLAPGDAMLAAAQELENEKP